MKNEFLDIIQEHKVKDKFPIHYRFVKPVEESTLPNETLEPIIPLEIEFYNSRWIIPSGHCKSISKIIDFKLFNEKGIF